MPQKILILAGPNGAGKTTFARAFLPAEAQCPHFINADLIATGLSPFNPDAATVKAGRLMLEEITAAVRHATSFALETTLSSRSYLRQIPMWQALGYHISLYFIRLPHPDYSVLRVAERVKQGGHNIPEATIRRRFAAGLANLDAYCAAVNHWAVYENTADRPALLAWGENRARHDDIAQAQNADLRASPTAMQRAALAARRIALQTDTAIIQTRDGQPVRIDAAALRQKPCHDMA